MKTFWLFIVKTYLKIGLFFYFKSIKTYGLENLPKDQPILLLSNHQNALLDALLIATRLDHFAYFLTRAGVFKKEFIAKLLSTLNMLPVYRIRDGWSNLTNNNSIFNSVTDLLHQNETVIIFPEGSHNLARRVRPLSKGFTRIVFDTLEKHPEIDLQLIPLGLNFVHAKDFGDSTALYFGNTIDATSYVLENRNDSVIKLKKDIQNAISKLTTDIPTENYETTLKKLNELNVDFLNPNAVNYCIKTNFKSCKQQPKLKLAGMRSMLKTLLILNVLVPYLIWKFMLQPKINEIEFTSTFRFAMAITLVPLYLLIVGAILITFLGIEIAMIYIFSVIILALLAVKI